MGKPPCCDNVNVKRGLWTAEEDAKILAYVSKHGTGNWTAAPKKAGLRRCGKSCRLRWTNYLRPDLKHDSFTPQEEELIVRLHAAIGSRWSIIAQQLPGRTDNDVKNYWNTKLRKKLSEMGIDPVTHKPFSQILADYGSIGGFLKSRNRIGSLNRDLKNAFTLKPEQYPSPAEAISNISSHLMTPMAPPTVEAEPIRDCFLNNYNNINNDTSNNTSDLLDQLQAIKLVTEASSYTKYEAISAQLMHHEEAAFSSTSSSSSTCSTAAQENSPITFSWRDFLLEDALLPTDPQEQESLQVEFSSSEFTSKTQNATHQDPQMKTSEVTTTNCKVGVEGKDFAVSSNEGFDMVPTLTTDSSFVEAILDRENKIFLDFPNLLEEPFQ